MLWQDSPIHIEASRTERKVGPTKDIFALGTPKHTPAGLHLAAAGTS
jgi:hypothetical protein